ncbi:hypothetical protein [Ensifer sp. Root31]|uniref:hypothetical protein n=1 Tax=Ensifer sp. Root31 TaxID=1736512 RepID=UPI000A454390|nr:hypothetical protein [Ensifer sp. Root31]
MGVLHCRGLRASESAFASAIAIALLLRVLLSFGCAFAFAIDWTFARLLLVCDEPVSLQDEKSKRDPTAKAIPGTNFKAHPSNEPTLQYGRFLEVLPGARKGGFGRLILDVFLLRAGRKPSANVDGRYIEASRTLTAPVYANPKGILFQPYQPAIAKHLQGKLVWRKVAIRRNSLNSEPSPSF